MKTIPLSEVKQAFVRFQGTTNNQYEALDHISIMDDSIEVPVITTLFRDIKAEIDTPITSQYPLNMRQWHLCSAVHCLAGWMVHIVPNRAGYVLEAMTGHPWSDTGIAAMAIFLASCPWATELPMFYHTEYESAYCCDNPDDELTEAEVNHIAMDYINRMASEEAAYNKEHRS